MFKVDVFVTKGRAFDARAFERATPQVFEEGLSPVVVASPEDTVLAKLEWFQMGDRVSERQWSDVIGVIRLRPEIDVDYLRRWAAELGVAQLLEGVLAEGQSAQ